MSFFPSIHPSTLLILSIHSSKSSSRILKCCFLLLFFWNIRTTIAIPRITHNRYNRFFLFTVKKNFVIIIKKNGFFSSIFRSENLWSHPIFIPFIRKKNNRMKFTFYHLGLILLNLFFDVFGCCFLFSFVTMTIFLFFVFEPSFDSI